MNVLCARRWLIGKGTAEYVIVSAYHIKWNISKIIRVFSGHNLLFFEQPLR